MSVRDMVAIVGPVLLKAQLDGNAIRSPEAVDGCIGFIVEFAKKLEQRIADEELKELTPPANLTPDQLASSQKVTGTFT